MKAKIIKTGEIVNIADYARVTLDACDSYGNPIEMPFEEVEILQGKSDGIDLEQRRSDWAKDFTAVILGRLNYDPFTANVCCSDGEPANPYSYIANIAVSVADALIAELKKGGKMNREQIEQAANDRFSDNSFAYKGFIDGANGA